MADDTRKVRVVEQLKIKIGEAKNLQGRNANSNNTSNYQRDVYCTVALDQEEISRTHTVERTLAPFFCEEYQFEIPRKFRYLAIYVWDRDRHLKQDRAIGKIAIKREELHKYNHRDHWFALRPVDVDSEVQGMIYVEVAIDEGTGNLKRKSNFDDTSSLPSSAFGSSDLKENNGTCGGGGGDGCGTSSATVSRSESVKTTVSSSGSTLGSKTRSLFGHPTELSLWSSSSQSKKTSLHILDPLRTTSAGKSEIAINVVQCADLARKNGNCDPYVVVTALYTNNKKIVKRTKVKKRTVHPQYGERLCFDLVVDAETKLTGNNAYRVAPLDGHDLSEISITVMHDAGISEHVFLGEIKLPMRGQQQQNAVQPKAWYFLQPRTTQSRPAQTCATPPGTRLSGDSKLGDNAVGSMRLQLVYSADYVFPLANYDQLLNMLLKSLDQQPITSSAVYILGETISNKTDVAQPLVRIFTHRGQISPIIKALADHEISKLTDPTTIFRGNTLVSKMMDEAMRLSGLHYLHNTLRPIVDAIVQERKPCEIDPTKEKVPALVERNLLNLKDYVERVFEAITKSAVNCPAVLCQIFHDLRECAAKYFPQNKEVRYSVVSGFIFLRFFAPAILGPKLFDLTTQPLDPQTNRTLTLISKTIQSLGNLVSSRSAQQPCKESYTGQLYKQFGTEKHVEAVKHYLEVISTVGMQPNQNTLLEPVLLKDGLMTKASTVRKRFGRTNFKQRYFRLTTQSLSYSKSKGKPTGCDIPLSDILAVTKLLEANSKMQNVFAIIQRERTLYVQTSNCVEEKEWVDLLSKICQSNTARLENIHTCAYINGVWTCCNTSDQDAPGCSTVSANPIEQQLANALDPARDLERLNSLIMANITRLEELYTNMATYTATFEDSIKTRSTLSELTTAAVSLDQVNRSYREKLMRDMKYGSLQAPIGDDNYLHMSGFGKSVSGAAGAQHQQQKLANRTVALYNQ